MTFFEHLQSFKFCSKCLHVLSYSQQPYDIYIFISGSQTRKVLGVPRSLSNLPKVTELVNSVTGTRMWEFSFQSQAFWRLHQAVGWGWSHLKAQWGSENLFPSSLT